MILVVSFSDISCIPEENKGFVISDRNPLYKIARLSNLTSNFRYLFCIVIMKKKFFSTFVSKPVIAVAVTLMSLQTGAQSTDFDKKIGAQNAKAADEEFGIYNDAQMTAYVEKVGQRLVKALDQTPFEFKFRIADDFTPNAFALPGGYVYVTRGILALVNSEDELAGVMAHEITHVTQRHSIKQMRRAILPQVLMLPGNLVGYVLSEHVGKLINAPINITTALTSSAYSRKQESEADTKGIALAAKAGYDPAALKTILDRLSNAIELITQQKERKGWLDDHPYTPDRVSNINEVSKSITWEKKSPISNSIVSELNGLLFFDSPNKGLFYDNVFVHPDLDFSIAFPKDWKTQNETHAVVAQRSDKKAAIYLGLEDPSKKAAEFAKEFEAVALKKHKSTPIVSEAKGTDAYLLVYEDKSGRENAYIHILWLRVGSNLIKLIGLAPKLMEQDLKESALSLHQLTKEERDTLKISVMRVVKAKEGETLQSIVTGSESTVPLNFHSIYNGIQSDQKLQSGQEVKVIKKELLKK